MLPRNEKNQKKIMLNLSSKWKFLITLIGFLIAIGATMFIFINLLNSSRESAYIEFSRFCNRKRTETMQQFLGGITILVSMRQQYMDRYLRNETISSSEWISKNKELVDNSDWQISFVSSLTYFPNNSSLFQYATSQNITIIPLPSMNKVVAVDHLLITQSYPNSSIVGVDYFTELTRYKIVSESIKSRNIAMSKPIFSTDNLSKSVLLFLPYFYNNQFIGGTSGFYRQNVVIVEKNETANIYYSVDVNNINFFTDDGFSGSAFKASFPFVIAGKTVNFSCGTSYTPDFTPFIILILGTTLSIILPTIVFYSTKQLRKVRQANNQRLIAEKEKNAASLAEQTAIQSNALKTAFLANVSHEIRTPLNGITGMTQFLLDTELDEEQRNYARIIKQSSGMLLSIVNDVLDYSKAESKMMLKENLICNIIPILYDIPQMYSLKVSDNNNEIRITHKGFNELWTITDPGRLQQIITNLFSNATKFTKNGIITLDCYVKNQQIVISVSDTGIGMTKEQLDILYTPFMQADASTTRKYGGTGLGLSICKRLVDLLDGEIQVKSEKGVGSKFTVILPYIPASNPTPVILDAEQNSENMNSFAKNKMILVVDDNKINLKVADKMLKNIGYSTVFAGNGVEAVNMVTNLSSNMHFSAILMDIQMPEMDGYTATQEIRKMNYSLPIIAMTANVLSGERQKCLDVGMDEYVTKPLNQLLLQKILFDVISSKSQNI